MTALLTDNLPLLAGAPNGIKKLRELILELAVRGKLVPQEPRDEPASELLKQIESEKKQLIERKIIRKGKPLPGIEPDEMQFKLPMGWEWMRLGQIGDWGAGATPARGNSSFYGGEMPWFKSGELVADFISVSEETVTELALKECSLRRNKPGDVLIAMYGATIGKTAILSVDGTTNQAVCACTPFNGVFNRYLLLTLKALKTNFIGQGAGGAQPNISREKIVATVTGLPPLSEQHRIVAKVDELMTLCDRMEAQQADSESAHAQLVQVLLDSLTQVSDPIDFAANWQRLAEHFHTLFTTEPSIDALKQTLLQLAVMGKLVPQDPSDEPASELLKRIAQEKARLVAEGKLKKQKPIVDINEKEHPFELPEGWSWARLDTLTQVITKGSSPKWQGVSYTDNPDDVLFVTRENVGSYTLRLDSRKYVEKKFNNIEPRSILEKGDFLMNIVGASIGRTAFFDIDANANINQAVCLIRVFHLHLESQFLLHFFNSDVCLSYMFDKQVDNARANLSMGNIAGFIIPIPPISEQHRIIAKVDQLMALCDQLKTRLTQARQLKEQLACTLVERALSEEKQQAPATADRQAARTLPLTDCTANAPSASASCRR